MEVSVSRLSEHPAGLVSIKISVAAMIMRVSGPVTPHYETHGATLAIPASGAMRAESPKRRASVPIDNFYGELENMRFVIVDSGPNRSTGLTVTAEHAKRREFVIIGEESNNRAPRCNTLQIAAPAPEPGRCTPMLQMCGPRAKSGQSRVASRESRVKEPGHAEQVDNRTLSFKRHFNKYLWYFTF